MDTSNQVMAQQIARAAREFERQRTGHAPSSVNVVLNDDTLVNTLRGASAPAEKAWFRVRPAPQKCESFTDSYLPTPPGLAQEFQERKMAL